MYSRFVKVLRRGFWFYMPMLLIIIALVLSWVVLFGGSDALLTAAVSAPNISASKAVVIDGDTGEVLYEKNAQSKAYPASVTKIMTALVVLETLDDCNSPWEQKVVIKSEAVGVEGSSIYLAAGEEISIKDLLYGMMLRSGNDAAVELAAVIGGTQEGFVEQMNRRAEEIGCRNTHFVNANGLFDEEHYTTAYDMALIASEAMKLPEFRELAAAGEYTADRETDKYNYFYNKNKVVHQYEGGNGIKIGYTKKSGRTLAASATRDGRTLICVVFDAPNWFQDAYMLMDHCFERK